MTLRSSVSQLDAGLLLASDHDNVTFLHYAEHIVDIPQARGEVQPVMEQGGRVCAIWRSSIPDQGRTRTGQRGFFPSGRHLSFSNEQRGGQVGDAQCFLWTARLLASLEHDEGRRRRSERPPASRLAVTLFDRAPAP